MMAALIKKAKNVVRKLTGNVPSEYNGVKCIQCGIALPPCTTFEDFHEERIDRLKTVDVCYVYNKGQYYRIIGHDGCYYCPVDFWQPKIEYREQQRREKEEREREKEREKEREQERELEGLREIKGRQRKRKRVTTEQSTAAKRPEPDRVDLFRTLSTGDLVDVLEVVESVSDWKRLGLTLGLLYQPTLNDIETNRRGKPDECRIDMLSAWLLKRDNVTQNGVPSWSVMRAALERMGEHGTADRISD